jgi:hypothetical protein
VQQRERAGCTVRPGDRPARHLSIHRVDGHVKRMKHFASATGRILAANRAERPGTYR